MQLLVRNESLCAATVRAVARDALGSGAGLSTVSPCANQRKNLPSQVTGSLKVNPVTRSRQRLRRPKTHAVRRPRANIFRMRYGPFAILASSVPARAPGTLRAAPVRALGALYAGHFRDPFGEAELR